VSRRRCASRIRAASRTALAPGNAGPLAQHPLLASLGMELLTSLDGVVIHGTRARAASIKQVLLWETRCRRRQHLRVRSAVPRASTQLPARSASPLRTVCDWRERLTEAIRVGGSSCATPCRRRRSGYFADAAVYEREGAACRRGNADPTYRRATFNLLRLLASVAELGALSATVERRFALYVGTFSCHIDTAHASAPVID
jgi:hypothetical protein